MAFKPCIDGDLLNGTADGNRGGTLHSRTLERVIVHEGLRGIDAVRSIMRQMAEGVAYLHGHSGPAERGLTHRDLKPANVFVKSGSGGVAAAAVAAAAAAAAAMGPS